MYYQLFIVNRNGTLVYEREFRACKKRLSTNEKITLSSTFHGMYEIAAQITPKAARNSTNSDANSKTQGKPQVGASGLKQSDDNDDARKRNFDWMLSGGIEVMETDEWKIHCFQSMTKVKFFVVCDPSTTDCEAVLKQTYEAYTDFVMKDPFYITDMPIRLDYFETAIDKVYGEY
eukprot:CAMPEP_0115016584 /NCGR_PEP_ID=MMETSP0216-20121206/27540_1 /TAXON_ID=223996 /ORGANISM="Protocruzia adherens, Strain Boccale" /LENGTH=174 /DNA_ID=CAMNT_0002387101 /DNA_START=27 /DNA_END=551 /DNA_ORIENTATION=+